MSKISVITTVYNGQKFFDRAIPSILHQSRSDFEWIIVDDGSTDRTLEFLKAGAAKDLRVKIYSPGRIGRALALNYAVERASGEYIANQDFDDTSTHDRLEMQAAFLDGHPEVGVVGGHYTVVDEERHESYIRQPPAEHADLAFTMAKCIPFAHTLAMFRKQAWQQAGGYPLVNVMIDYRLWIEIGRHGWQFATFPDVLGTHYIYPDSYWKKYFHYGSSQMGMAGNQFRAILALRLPLWTLIYPAGRLLYWMMPTGVKRLARRRLAGSRERDTGLAA